MDTNKSKAREAAMDWWKSPQSRIFWDGVTPRPGDFAICDSCGQPIPPMEGYLCMPQKLVCEECFDSKGFAAYERAGGTEYAPSFQIHLPQKKKWWQFWK